MQPGIQPRCFWKSSRGSCPSTTPSPGLHNCLNLVSILCSPGALHSAAALLKQGRWGKGRGHSNKGQRFQEAAASDSKERYF